MTARYSKRMTIVWIWSLVIIISYCSILSIRILCYIQSIGASVIVKKGAIRTIIAKVKIPRTKIKMGWWSQGPRWNVDSGLLAKTSSVEY